jgi:hypothetical protein
VLVQPCGVIPDGHTCARREATKVRRWCKDRALRIWGIGLAVLLVVTATACMSHSDAHDLPHPLLCLDTPCAIIEGQTPLRQFAASRPLQFFLKYAALIVLSPGISILHIAEQEAQDHPLFWPLHHLRRHSLRALLAVFHL